MKALTLKPWWASAVCHLGKDIENRMWVPPESLLGQRLAIHAGALDAGIIRDADGLAFIRYCKSIGVDPSKIIRKSDIGRAYEMVDPLYRSAIVAVVTVAGYLNPCGDYRASQKSFVDGVLPPFGSLWQIPDCYGWHLTDLIVLPHPIPAKGKQGLWTLTESQEQAVMEQIDNRRGAA